MAGKGGRTPGAGRKKVYELQAAKDVFTPHADKAVKCLVDAAEKGNIKAAEIVAAYAFGKPNVTVEVTGKLEMLVIDDDKDQG